MMRGRARRTMAPVRMTHAADLVAVEDPNTTRYEPVTNARM
jgi:hypothetical protein